MNVDFIIVGQGIAGTCFAFELLKNKKTFIIIDEYRSNTSSRVALGIYNPLVLKWFTKPWNIDNQLTYFYHFYNQINKFLNHNFFYDIGIYKFLHTPYEQNNWLTKQTSVNRSQYMSPKLFSISNKQKYINDTQNKLSQNKNEYENIIVKDFSKKTSASPKVRKFARELGVNINKVPGSERQGRVTESDVKLFVATKSDKSFEDQNTTEKKIELEYSHSDFGEVDIKDIPRVKKLSSKYLMNSWSKIPHVTNHD